MRHFAFAVVTALAPSPAIAAQGLDTLQVREQFARFATDSTPGCAIAIERGGTLLLARAWGMADLERNVPNTPATIFEAGSVSKQFVAAAVITLAERGRLSLDDDVRKWFPEMHDYGTPITIRHLLQHTSGLRDWGAVVELEGWPRGTRTIDHRHVLEVIARQRELNHPVGARYSYTNSGYSLLTMLVERVVGESLVAFTRREFFEPFGMTHTTWRDDYARVVRGRAQAYALVNGQWKLDMPFENPHGHGGLLTTVGDLMIWNRALAERRVGSRRVAEIMEDVGVLTDGRRITYGGGLTVDSVRGVREIGHSGATAGYRTHLARYPASGVSAAVLCNAGNASATAMLRESVAQVAGFLPQSRLSVGTNSFENASVTIPPPPRGAALRAYTGTWRSTEADARWTISVSGDSLFVARHAGDRQMLRATQRDRFSAGFGGIQLQFERNAADSVVGLRASIARALNVRFERASVD